MSCISCPQNASEEQRARVGAGSRGQQCHCQAREGGGGGKSFLFWHHRGTAPTLGMGTCLIAWKIHDIVLVHSEKYIFRFTSIGPGLAFPSREWRFDSIPNEINKLTEFDFMTCGLCFKRPCHTEVTWDFLLNLDNKPYWFQSLWSFSSKIKLGSSFKLESSLSPRLKITCWVLSVHKRTAIGLYYVNFLQNWVKCRELSFVPKPPFLLCVWQFEAGGKLAKLSSPVFTVFTQS